MIPARQLTATIHRSLLAARALFPKSRARRPEFLPALATEAQSGGWGTSKMLVHKMHNLHNDLCIMHKPQPLALKELGLAKRLKKPPTQNRVYMHWAPPRFRIRHSVSFPAAAARLKYPMYQTAIRFLTPDLFGSLVLRFFDFSPLGANWIRPDARKRKWRAVVDQLATLKADHNFTSREQSRTGCLTRLPLTAGLSRRGPKVSRQIRTAASHVGYARG